MGKTVRISVYRQAWRKASAVLLAATAIFFAARFLIPGYPFEFSGDEMYEIRAAAGRWIGETGFFAFDRHSIGAFGNLFFQLLSFFTPLVREKIELYRTVTAAFSGLTLAGIYMLALSLYNRRVALIALFFSSASFWMFFNSRLVVSNNLSLLTGVWALYFFDAGMKGRRWMLAAAAVCIAFCSNTYINWVLVPPVMLWMSYEAWRSGSVKARAAFWAACGTVILTATLALYQADNSGMFARTAHVLSTQGPSGILGLAGNLASVVDIFVTGNGHYMWFLPGTPFLNPAESLLFFGGAVLMASRLRRPSNRVSLVMLALFVAPFFAQPHIHQIRIVQAPAAFSIIAAVFCARLFGRGRGLFVFAVFVAAALNVFLVYRYFTAWEGMLFRDRVNIDMAHYLNSNCKCPDYLGEFEYNYLEEPARTRLRLKCTYAKGAKKEEVAFKLNGLWEREAGAYFKGKAATLKLFESSAPGQYRRFPYLLVVIPGGDPASADAAAAARVIKDAAALARRDGAAAGFGQFFSGDKGKAMLNTVLKDIRSNALLDAGMYRQAIGSYLDLSVPSWVTPDFYFKISACYDALGERAKSQEYLEKYAEVLGKPR